MIVVQGAGGGGEQLSSTGFYGGGGGFVHGLLEVKGGEKLIVVVGDGGRAGNTPQVQKAVNMRIPRTHLCMHPNTCFVPPRQYQDFFLFNSLSRIFSLKFFFHFFPPTCFRPAL